MNPTSIAMLVFACLVASVLLGMRISAVLPDHHLATESKEVVRLGMGLIATMAALVLGLVIASAKSAFDTETGAVRNSAADMLVLDRSLAEYGSDAAPIRAALRQSLAMRIARIWPDGSQPPDVTGGLTAPDRIELQIRALSPRNDLERELRARALEVVGDLQKTRWLALEAAEESIPPAFLIVLTFWLSVLFASFGLFAPRNPTVIAALVICALSVSGSIFLILEMDHPFAGIVKVSSGPLRFALEQLGN